MAEKDKLIIQLKKHVLKLKSNQVIEKLEPETFKKRINHLLLNSYMEIERELLVLRLSQINEVITAPVFICDECHNTLAIIECKEC